MGVYQRGERWGWHGAYVFFCPWGDDGRGCGAGHRRAWISQNASVNVYAQAAYRVSLIYDDAGQALGYDLNEDGLVDVPLQRVSSAKTSSTGIPLRSTQIFKGSSFASPTALKHHVLTAMFSQRQTFMAASDNGHLSTAPVIERVGESTFCRHLDNARALVLPRNPTVLRAAQATWAVCRVAVSAASSSA